MLVGDIMIIASFDENDDVLVLTLLSGPSWEPQTMAYYARTYSIKNSLSPSLQIRTIY